jgi:hypothetical protein
MGEGMEAMSDSNRGQQRNAEPERESVDHEPRPPYWKGAHRDWRIWVALVFMFAAITI